MTEHAKHIEMPPDRMGNHVNLKGVAVFQITIDESSSVTSAKAVSGNPLAINLLISDAKSWQFEPYVEAGIARKACGRIAMKFSIAEGIASAQVLK
jgi:hypothetical protein